MKRLPVFVLLVLLMGTLAAAQDTPKFDFFGGYQFVSVDAKDIAGRQSAHGWNFDLAGHVKKHFAIVADIGGTYKTFAATGGTLEGGNVNSHIHTFLFGPRFAFTRGKVTPFTEALFGLAHLSGSAFDQSRSFNKFGMALGGGLDVKLAPKVSLRLAKLDYLMIRFNDTELDVHENLNNVRISTGFVFNF